MLITISSAAALRIQELLKNETDGTFFRIRVLSGGCSGFQYEFQIDQQKQENDLTFGDVVIDDLSLSFVEGAELHYTESLGGASFSLVNPKAMSSCGCGNSFAI